MNELIIFAFLSFQLIPPQYQSRDKLYGHFDLPDSITWWNFGHCNLITNHHESVFCSDSSIRVDLPPLKFYNTFHSVYFNYPGEMDYLFYKTESGQLRFINKLEELQSLIGSVDNLAEALFLASIYGYSVIPGMDYGSYCFQDGFYIMNLYKISDEAGSLPVINIDSKGNQIDQKPIKARIRVDINGNIFLMTGNKNKKAIKLQSQEMY
jgi:hypothetical protein